MTRLRCKWTSPEAPYNYVLGALSDSRLTGILGVSVEPRAKVQQKGNVFGMYVAPEYAGRGVGQKLLTACRLARGPAISTAVRHFQVTEARRY